MRTLLPALVALTFFAGSAVAECETTPSTATVATPLAMYYVVSDPCEPPGCLWSLWVYEETNGQIGLQRPDEICLDDGRCCGSDGDTLIF